MNVLPRGYLANTTPVGICPCQYGPSGHCAAGNCTKCPRTWEWERHGHPEPETHLVSNRHWAALAPVWRVGTPCRWLCPCVCHTTVDALFSSPVRTAPKRASVTGGNQRIASTDNLRRYDPDAPTLFEVTS